MTTYPPVILSVVEGRRCIEKFVPGLASTPLSMTSYPVILSVVEGRRYIKVCAWPCFDSAQHDQLNKSHIWMKIWNTRSGYDIIQVLAGRSNVFLLTDRHNTILIDTSIRLAWNRLNRRLRKLGIKKIDYLILTHSHFDHAANAYYIKKEFGAKVLIQSREAKYLESGNNHIPRGTSDFTQFLMDMASFVAPLFKNKPCEYDILFDARFEFNEGLNAYVLHTPGHSPGSSSVIIDDEIALVGDCMIGSFRWTVFPPFADNTNETFDSWQKLLATKCTLFIPSHGREIKRERIEEFLNS